jgi:hypothetical protein
MLQALVVNLIGLADLDGALTRAAIEFFSCSPHLTKTYCVVVTSGMATPFL